MKNKIKEINRKMNEHMITPTIGDRHSNGTSTNDLSEISGNIFKTPLSSSSSSHQDGSCLLDVCAICLSPLDSYSIIETKCRHSFHRECLNAAKERRTECPLCRHELTPIPGRSAINTHVSNTMRYAIIDATSRGRNAVR